MLTQLIFRAAPLPQFAAWALVLISSSLTACGDDRLSLARPAADGVIFGSTMPLGSPQAQEMTELGYTEEEYFLSGYANVYRYGPDKRAEVATSDLPFTTRLLIVRPTDLSTFSGRVIFEPFHPTGSNGWASLRSYYLRSRDIYVGVYVGSGGLGSRRPMTPMPSELPADSLTALLEFDPVRYAPMKNWPADDGVSWDVFGQAARLLRSDSVDNPLRAVDIQRMYAVGWSATGSFLRTYTNEGFHDLYRQRSGAPALNGYLVGISQGSFAAGYSPLSNETEPLANDDPRRLPRPLDVPVIELMSESEAVTKLANVEDSDDAVGAHRYYEVPGTTHFDALVQSSGSWASECPVPPSDVPFRALTYAALTNLDAWTRGGSAPPKQAAPITVIPPEDTTAGIIGRAVKDELGNATGGIRTAEIAVPLARYGETGDPRCASPTPSMLEMRRIELDRNDLERLYPDGSTDYLRRYETHLDELIAEGWLLSEDRADLIANAESNAANAFP